MLAVASWRLLDGCCWPLIAQSVHRKYVPRLIRSTVATLSSDFFTRRKHATLRPAARNDTSKDVTHGAAPADREQNLVRNHAFEEGGVPPPLVATVLYYMLAHSCPAP